MYTQSLSTYKMMIKINDDKDDKNICIPTEEKKKNIYLICLKMMLYHAEM